ncbi:uncharacterized protein [Amphiura filiformis]|uniref:uncharacterized protein n=1 Tax=Amphiura filiformis TaxID=82378 RepID=UPI003B220917
MTFALKLWSTLLTCADWNILWHASETTIPNYAAIIGGQNQVKGQILGHCFIDLLVTARTCGYWDEGSVRNAWLVAVNELMKPSDVEQVSEMQYLLGKTDAVDVAFICLDDSSLFVVASAQDLISSWIHKLCWLVMNEQKEKFRKATEKTDDTDDTVPAKMIKLDSATTATSSSVLQSTEQQLCTLLQRLNNNLQSSTQSSSSQSRLSLNLVTHQPVTHTTKLKLATIGVVKRLWQCGDSATLSLLDEKLSWMAWCYKTLQEDGEFGRDVRLAVVEALPVVLTNWPWSSQDAQQVKLLSDFFQLPIQVLRWQGIQCSLQIARALHNARLIMIQNMPDDLLKQVDSNPSQLQMLLVPLTSILQSSPDVPRPRRKLLGFAINPHTDSATRLAEVQDEVVLQIVQGQVSCVKLVCQCVDTLMEVVEKLPVLTLIQDIHLMKHLSSLLSLCWSHNQQLPDGTDVTNVGQKLSRSSKVTKAALTLLSSILDKLTHGKSDDSCLDVDSLQGVLKEICISLTHVLTTSIGDQTLMCKTLDTLTKLYISSTLLSTTHGILSADLLDCIQKLAEEDICSWEIRDSALGVLVAIIQYGNDSDLMEAKKRRYHVIIWDCVGDHEGFVQASAVSALPILYEKIELWQDMLQQCQVTEVAVVSDIVHFLRVSGNPFVRSAAIATLTRWLTNHSDIKSSVLQACQVQKDDAPSVSMSSLPSAPHEVNRKPAPKDVPGVVSGYFQDILEAEVDVSTSEAASDNQVQDIDNKAMESCREDTKDVKSMISLPSQHIGNQILSTMYQATNSSDVETSFKTLDFWGCLYQLHVPEYVVSLDMPQLVKNDKSCDTVAKELYKLFDCGNLTQEKLLAQLSKSSEDGLDSLRNCLRNTGCLGLMLGMLSDSKMAAKRVCFMLQILQGVFLVNMVESENQEEVDRKPSSEKDVDVAVSAACSDVSGSQQDKEMTDLQQSLGSIMSADKQFEEMFKEFLHLDFVTIGHIIRTREIDTLDSVLDDMIEPSDEWGLPGDINVDCY